MAGKELNISSVKTSKTNKTVSKIKENIHAGEKAFSQDKNESEQVINARKAASLNAAKLKAKKKKAKMAKASRKKNKK